MAHDLDIVIFGATGFTGKYVVEEFAKIGHGRYTWGVAGRNHKKLEHLLSECSARTGQDVTKKVPIIIAECENVDSISEMARRAKVVINCCGPYRFFGETVVKACVENGTHHVDVSGEPEYMEKVQVDYNEQAEEKGVYVVSACGFDSVPADLGIVHFANNFKGQVNSVESYMKYALNTTGFAPVVNYATWESAVYGFTHQKNLGDIRKKLFAKFPRQKLEPKLQPRPSPHKSPVFDNKRSLPFPGSDRSVVVRSQLMLNAIYGQRPIQYNAYMICSNIVVLWGITLIFYLLQMLTKYKIGRMLLLKYPKLFSLGVVQYGGIPEDVAAKATVQIKFVGDGWSEEVLQHSTSPPTTPPDKTMTTEVFCRSPAYGFTSICVILCATILLDEKHNLPPKGGVYTPGAAFAKTSLIENLSKYDVSFKVLDENVQHKL